MSSQEVKNNCTLNNWRGGVTVTRFLEFFFPESNPRNTVGMGTGGTRWYRYQMVLQIILLSRKYSHGWLTQHGVNYKDGKTPYWLTLNVAEITLYSTTVRGVRLHAVWKCTELHVAPTEHRYLYKVGTRKLSNFLSNLHKSWKSEPWRIPFMEDF